MGGIAKRSSYAVQANTEGQMVDNYAIFLARIEEAQQSMREKLDQNKRRIAFLKGLHDHAASSRDQWNRRVTDVNAAIDCYSGGPAGYEALANLLSTAKRMHTAYIASSSSLEETINQLQQQETPLINHINQLTAAKGKLRSAQSVELSKGNMDRIVSSITSTALPAITVKEDQELRDIRRLIAESEALVELKGQS